MLKSYLITAWRNLRRNRLFSAINLFGLSISVAFCLLLFYHIRWEQSFDTFHAKKDRLYRCEMSAFGQTDEPKPATGFFSMLDKGNEVDNNLEFPLVCGPDLQRNFPEVAGFVRMKSRFHDGAALIRAGESVYKEEEVLNAEDNFFTIFSFPLLKGNARTVLAEPGNVVLSASAARKYFGDADPIGKTITLIGYDGGLFRVSGVAADAPGNSSIRFNLVMPIEASYNYKESLADGFNRMNDQLIVELKPGVDRNAFEKKMNAWVRGYIKPYMDTVWNKGASASVRDGYHWELRSLADCHYNISKSWGHYTDGRALYQLTCIVAIILLLASLNYVLITVSNAAARSQEVGVRKVMGAGRKGIILQSWISTQLTVGIAVGFGLLLSLLGLPILRSVIGSEVTLGALSLKDVVLAAVGLALLLGVLAGYYPALLISRLKPVSIIKSFSSLRINPRFSRVLVVVQFSCCVVLMTAAFVIDRQLNFIIHKDLGFDKEQVLVINSPTFESDFNGNARNKLYAFARTRPEVVAWSGMGSDLMGANNTNGFILNGKQEWRKQLWVDYDYFRFLKLKIVQGREFSRDFASDTAKVRSIVVNETLFNMLGKDAAVGTFNKALGGLIIGVVKDYNFESLTKKIEPEEHRLKPAFVNHFLFKIRPGQTAAAISLFEAEWKKITNNYPFAYSFLDASLQQMYEADMRWQRAMKAASFFALLIACMGLFGLSAISAANRVKEVGIRKVLGASVRELVGTLASGFLVMVLLSIVIALPLGWWMMNKWLEDFAYRIDIQWWMLGIVGLMAVVIAMATVSFTVLKAARANPVEALRNE